MGSLRDWGYFKLFQKAMKSRERIPKHVVEKYSIEIYFMVKNYETLMEAVIPKKIWLEEMGYEVDARILDAYSRMLIDVLTDESE